MFTQNESSNVTSQVPLRKLKAISSTDMAWKQNVRDIRMYYSSALQVQTLRIQQGNRICGNIRSKLDQQAGVKNITITKLMDKIKEDYKMLSESLTESYIDSDQFTGFGVITDFVEKFLMDQWTYYYNHENLIIKQIKKELEKWPIYTEYLKKITGVGPMSGACLISYVNINIADTVSKINGYMGVDPLTVGYTDEGLPIKEGRGKGEGHLINAEYLTKKGKIAIKKSITFNDLLKSKMLGVMCPSLIKQFPIVVKPTHMEKGYYRTDYLNHKEQLVQRPDIKKGLEIFMARKKIKDEFEDDELITTTHRKAKDKKDGAFSPMHVNRMAIRHMQQTFNKHLYAFWRELEGLEVRPPYEEEKLGIFHSGL